MDMGYGYLSNNIQMSNYLDSLTKRPKWMQAISAQDDEVNQTTYPFLNYL